MRVLVIGSVRSTEQIIKGLIKNNIKPVGILGFDYRLDNRVIPASYCDLSLTANSFEIPYQAFNSINDAKHLKWANELNLDLIFAVGFSQLLSPEWFKISKKGCIGFHPTVLPKGRGRAPLAWLILEEKEGAANFFLMGEGTDDGPIFEQIRFKIKSNDTVSSVESKLLRAIDNALDKWIPKLLMGEWSPIQQNHEKATYFGVRKPKDGIIDWNALAEENYRLIRASLKPHPGAFTFLKNQQIEIIDVNKVEKNKIKGVIGRVLEIRDGNWFLVQCLDEPLWIKLKNDIAQKVKIGTDLMYDIKLELDRLENRIKLIEEKLQ